MEAYSVRCPICGKILSPETNQEACPNSPYLHGRHPIVVLRTGTTSLPPNYLVVQNSLHDIK